MHAKLKTSAGIKGRLHFCRFQPNSCRTKQIYYNEGEREKMKSYMQAEPQERLMSCSHYQMIINSFLKALY